MFNTVIKSILDIVKVSFLIGIIKRKPIKNETANNIQNRFDDQVEHNK